MAELSKEDQLYLAVGRCLTAWNKIEERVANIIELLTKPNPTDSDRIGEIVAGYWAVNSFEARLKWCDAVVSYRVSWDDRLKHLAPEWNALNNALIRKARQRAEIAHGSVVTMPADEGSDLVTAFVPYFTKHIARTATSRPLQRFWQNTKALSVKDLQQREASFDRMRERLRGFSVDVLMWDDPKAAAASKARFASNLVPPWLSKAK